MKYIAIALYIGIAIDIVLLTNLIAVAYLVNNNVPENVLELLKWLCL